MPLTYDTERLRQDLALREWFGSDLARAAGVSDMTVTRALRGGPVSARMMGRLARALGFTIRRYLVTRRAA